MYANESVCKITSPVKTEDKHDTSLEPKIHAF
jgi:hypothetical protein